MDSIQQLIQKFWAGETSEEENLLLLGLLEENEHALSEADKAVFFKIKEERTVFVETSRTHSILERLHEQMKDKPVAVTTGETASVVPMKRNRMWWAAASVIILLGLGAWLFFPFGSRQHAVADNNVKQGNRQLKTISNHGDTAMTIALQDGSVVNVSGHSAIAFYEPFEDAARNISMNGEATFKVAKDASRPFTVYANGIATTALGTVFTVSTQLQHTISVKLLEGKVVIRSVDTGNALAMERVYLVPGQEFTINTLTRQYLVKTNSAGNDVASGAVNNKTEKPEIAGVVLSFNNEPLAHVFRRLEQRYGVKIRFNEKDIAGLYFSGKVLKDDSLQIVLSAICNSNQLSFSREQGQIQIHIQQ